MIRNMGRMYGKISGRNIAIAGVVIIAVIIVIALVTIVPIIAKPTVVTLTGTVTTTGTGTTPERITFTSYKTGSTYVAAVYDHSYSIQLPNGETYKVKITYKFLGLITVGEADAGTLDLDSSESSIVRNWVG